MKYLVFALFLTLPGCAATQLKPFLDNLSHDCTRHYTGSVGLTGTTVAFDIACAPEGTTTTTTVTTPKAIP